MCCGEQQRGVLGPRLVCACVHTHVFLHVCVCMCVLMWVARESLMEKLTLGGCPKEVRVSDGCVGERAFQATSEGEARLRV